MLHTPCPPSRRARARRSATASALGVLLLAGAASAQEGASLLRVLERTTAVGTTTTDAFAVPTTEGRWFVTVSRTSDKTRGEVVLNGTVVLSADDLKLSPSLLLRAEVSPALSNSLRVSAEQGELRVLVEGVVSDGHVATADRRHVAFMRLFEEPFDVGQRRTVGVSAPAVDGLFTLRLQNMGVASATVDWNTATLFGRRQVTPQVDVVEAALAVVTTNSLAVQPMGRGGRVIVTVEGWVVDAQGPVVAILHPAAGAHVGADDAPIEVEFSDSISGVDPSALSIRVNGVEVRDRFLVTASRAAATLADVPPEVLVDGENVLEVTLRDRATNETRVASSFFLVRTPGVIVATPSSVELGEVDRPGVVSATVTVANTSAVPVEVRALSLVGPDAARFSLANVPTLPQTLAPGAALTVDVVFDGSAPEGTYAATLEIGSSISGPALQVPVTAASASPQVTLSPASADLGAWAIGGAPATVLVTVGNASTRRDLVVSGAALRGDAGFAIAGLTLPLTVAPGGSASFEVTFTPTAAGDVTAALDLSTNDPDQPTATLTLAGRGVELVVTLGPASPFAFGSTRVSSSVTQTFTLTNETQGLPVTITGITGLTGPDFALARDGATGKTIAAGGSETFEVRFEAARVGTFTDRLEIATSAGAIELLVSGTAALPELDVAASLAFPKTFVGEETQQELELRNTSTGVPLVVRALATSAPFRVVGLVGGAPIPPEGLVVGVSSAVRVVVGFAPADVGAFTGTLVVDTDDPDRPNQPVALAGTGKIVSSTVIELTLLPGPATGVAAASFQQLRVRAVKADGTTDTAFTGVVELTTTDPFSSFNELLVLFDVADQGVVVTPFLPAFLTGGAQTITASLLLPDDTQVVGSLDVQVAPAERGQAYAVISPATGTLAPGDELEVRLLVDCGPDDGDPETLSDTLGAYDVRLLVDPYALDVVEVTGGAILGEPLFQLPGQLRFMGLNATGTPQKPGPPNPAATRVVELATVRLRVRASAPPGRTPVVLAVDALATAEPSGPGLKPLGRPGPRLGAAVGEVRIESSGLEPALAALGGLPRAGEGLIATLQDGAPTVVHVVLSRALNADAVGGAVNLATADGTPVSGSAVLGSDPFVATFTANAPLAPGDYVLTSAVTLASAAGKPLPARVDLPFRIGAVPSPRDADLDGDGEVTITDLALRRDRLVRGETVVEFPPLFVRGIGTIIVQEGARASTFVRVLDLQGRDVILSPEGLPDFVTLTRVSGDLFELSFDARFVDGGTTTSFTLEVGGESVEVTVVIENLNTAPKLALLAPATEPLAVFEGDTLVFTVEAVDPDLTDPVAPDLVTFTVLSQGIPNLSAPVLSGSRQERATFTFKPTFTQAGSYELEVKITDRAGASVTRVLPIAVREFNRPPVLASIAPVQTNTSYPLGSLVTLEWRFTDPDGDPVEASLDAYSYAELSGAVTIGRISDLQRQISGGRVTVSFKLLTQNSGGSVYAFATDGKSYSTTIDRGVGVIAAPPGLSPLVSSSQFLSDAVPLHASTDPDSPPEQPPTPIQSSQVIQIGTHFSLQVHDPNNPLNKNKVRVVGAHAANIQELTWGTRRSSRGVLLGIDVVLVKVAPPILFTNGKATGSSIEVELLNGTTVRTPIVFVPGGGTPELTMVQADPDNTTCFQKVRVHLTEPHLVTSVGVQGPVFENSIGARIRKTTIVSPTDDPTAPIELDLIIEMPPVGPKVEITANYAGGQKLLPIPIAPDGSRIRRLSGENNFVGDRFFVRPHRDPQTGQVTFEPFETTRFKENHDLDVASILPQNEAPEAQDTGPDNPYVVYYAYAFTGLDDGTEVVTSGWVAEDGTLTALQPIAMRPGSAATLLRRMDGTLTDKYRISLPMFFEFRDQGSATATPFRVAGDRIVISVGWPNMEKDLFSRYGANPPSFPPPDLVDTVAFVEANELGQVGNWDWQNQIVSPGIVKVGVFPLHDVLLEGAQVECEDTIMVWFPFRETAAPDPYTLYLDGDDGKPLVPLEPRRTAFDRGTFRVYEVHQLLATVPELTPGEHRVRLYATPPAGMPPTGRAFLEATFELLIAERPLVFKTDINHPAPRNCDGAFPGDPEQEEVIQGDIPFGDGDSPSTSKSGASVLHATGEEILERVDLEIPGIGMNFVVSRTYRSKVLFNGPLGHSWDFNWYDNLHIVPVTQNVERQNGHGRKSTWTYKLASGTYETPPGHFSTLVWDGAFYVLTEPDGMKRIYRADGLLDRIVDRNSNQFQVTYDHHKNIETVVDTVGRTIRFVFEEFTDIDEKDKWRLKSIIDFGSRVVEYSYDLRNNLIEVKGPNAAGQVRKSERYEYINALNSDLDHNLTKVFNATSPTTPWLQITYGLNPADRRTYDRVVKEIEGDATAGGGRTFTYEPANDDQYPGKTLLQVSVLEPNGSVHRHLIDADPAPVNDAPPRSNHEIWTRAMTRRGLGQTPLRADEPEHYETRCLYNPDGLLAVRINPLKNREVFTYETESRSRQCNVRERARMTAGGERHTTTYTYEPRFNQVASVTDARGSSTTFVPPLGGGNPAARHTTTFSYDANGNLQRVDNPTVTLESGGSQPVFSFFVFSSRGQLLEIVDPDGTVTRHRYDDLGNLHETIVDPSGLALRTEYTHDLFGNITAVVNPRGTKTSFTINTLNQVTMVVRAEGSADPATSIKTRSVYDADGRVTSMFEESPTGQELERKHTYDILGNVRVREVQQEDGTWLTTRYAYDQSNNLTQVTSPLGHKTVMQYDERNLPYTVTRGANDVVRASTMQIDYDGNGNRLRVIDGRKKVTTFTYDGFDRQVEQRSPHGTRTTWGYDIVGNVVETTVFGTPGGAGPAVALSSVLADYDELKRPFRTTTNVLDAAGLVTGRVITHTTFDEASRPTLVIEAEASGTSEVVRRRTEIKYDRAGRVIRMADNAGDVGAVQAGNVTERVYDDNGNATLVRVTELAPGTNVAPRPFTTLYEYDALDRVKKVTDNANQATTFEYDRRSHLARRVDPSGNVANWVHDGLDRLTAQTRELKPANTPVGVSFAYDDDGRVVSITDANGRVTTFGYDALDRRTSRKHADDSTYTFFYDFADNVVITTDPNQTTRDLRYDDENRLIQCLVQRGTGSAVEGPLSETYDYDGLSRLVRATTHLSASDTETCTWAYDSVGRVVVETQAWLRAEETESGERTIRSTYAPAGGRTQLATGDRTLTFTLDNLQRPTAIKDGVTPIAAFRWAGPGMRELWRWHGNNTLQTYLNPAGTLASGYDALQRVTSLRVFPGVANPDVAATSPSIVGRDYRYGPAGERTAETRHDDGGLRDEYVHDSLYRTTLSSFDLGPEVATRRDLRSRSYQLDAAGNRTKDIETSQAVGATTATVTSHVYGVNELNQYTTVAVEGASAPDPRTYDKNGNLTFDGVRRFTYDFKDRLVRVAKGGVTIAEYTYLPDGRRMSARLVDGTFVSRRRTVWDGPQEIEELTALGATLVTYTWAPGYVDDLLQFQRLGQTYYVHSDARSDVVAVTDATGSIVEQRRYDDYGHVEFRANATSEWGTESVVKLDYGFQGRRHDPITGLIYFRARYYDPDTGRFLTRDPVWDPNNDGNDYTFVGNNPGTLRDPTGEIAPLLAYGIITVASAAIHAAQDYYVQSVTTAGFTAGKWDAKSTGLSAAGGALTGATALVGGPVAGRVGKMVATRLVQAASGEVIGEAVGAGVSKVMEAWGRGGGEEEEFDNCFLAGTNAETTSRGDVNIEDVRLGDRFAPPPGHACEDPRCGEVVRLFPGQTDQVVTITAVTRPRAREHRSAARDGGEAGGEDAEPPSASQRIRCTPGHPFFVEGKGWVFAADLRDGDEFEARGVPLVVASIEVRAERAETFNFEVRCHHTYRVSGAAGQPAVLVHNVSKRVMERVARVLARGGTLTPRHFGKQTLSENPALLAIWNRAVRKSLRSSEDNAYKTYAALTAAGKAVPDDVLKNAWSSVQGNFLGLARRAGHNLATVHHWNFPRHAFSGNVFDPRHLVPITMRENARGMHYFIHKSVTGARGPGAWFGGVGKHAIDLGGP